jgi:uncharacterized protein YcfJ
MSKSKTFLLIAAAGGIAYATTAYARERAQDAWVMPSYETVTRYVPVTKKVCEKIQVPVYGDVVRRGSDGEVLGGAVIGGAVGNQFGNGSGKDIMTVLGAIMGANAGAKPKTERVITGYKYVKQCDNVEEWVEKTERVYSHSTITFEVDGKTYNVEFQR